MKKILCIDDLPDDVLEEEGRSLREILTDTFSSTPYELIFKTTAKEGIDAAMSDPEIDLVLLDVMFDGKVEGPEIADALSRHAPNLKIVVLTSIDEKGKKVSFKAKYHTVCYVVKSELSKYIVLEQLKNLATAIIEDYENKNWEIEFVTGGTINLKHTVTNNCYGVNFPSGMSDAIKEAIAKPNTPITNPGGSTGDAGLGRVLNKINERVLEGTGWNTWGILTREHCATGQFKLLIGSVAGPSGITAGNLTWLYVPLSDFEKYKEDTEKRLTAIEKLLRNQGHTL